MTEPCTKCMVLQQQVDWFNRHVVAIIDTEENSIRNLGDAEEDIRVLKLQLQEVKGLLKNRIQKLELQELRGSTG